MLYETVAVTNGFAETTGGNAPAGASEELQLLTRLVTTFWISEAAIGPL